MGRINAQGAVERLMALADIRVGGGRPWDITVHNPDFFPRVLAGGSLALGESYMDGWWDCEALDQLSDRVMSVHLDSKVRKMLQVVIPVVLSRLRNAQRKSRAFVVGEHHYDVGNDLYRAMLDRRMIYSCGYWNGADILDDAQEAKLDLICRKIGIKPGMRILDIGCGWGSLAQYVAERYQAEVVGITVSVEQVNYTREVCCNASVDIRLQDYRDLNETFDHIVSVGMFEHVGYRNYRTFMETVHRCLAPDGRFLLHTIGGGVSRYGTDPWINKYIFPNSMLPSTAQITQAAEGLFVLQDWHNFGTHYDRTLMAWHENFTSNWDSLREHYDQRFYRMWVYYLLICAGTFRSRRNHVWQIVFTKAGSRQEYTGVR